MALLQEHYMAVYMKGGNPEKLTERLIHRHMCL